MNISSRSFLSLFLLIFSFNTFAAKPLYLEITGGQTTGIPVALDLKGENAAEALGEHAFALCDFVITVVGQRRVVHLDDRRVLVQELGHGLRVGILLLHAQR